MPIPLLCHFTKPVSWPILLNIRLVCGKETQTFPRTKLEKLWPSALLSLSLEPGTQSPWEAENNLTGTTPLSGHPFT